MQTERRLHPRWNCTQPVFTEMRVPGDDGISLSEILDLSHAGAKLSCDSRVLPEVTQGKDVMLLVEDGNFSGTVSWASLKEEGGKGYVGVVFSPGQAEKIHWLLTTKTDLLDIKLRQHGNECRVTPAVVGELSIVLKEFIDRFRRILDKLSFAATNESRDESRRKFQEACQAFSEQIEKVARSIQDPKFERAAKKIFREAITPWLESNPFIRRSLEKPRGYPGDYMMMEMGYESVGNAQNDQAADEFDRFCYTRYACILNRKEYIKQQVAETLAKCEHDPILVLSLGGGPAREWKEIDNLPIQNEKKVQLLYLDQDEEALLFAKSHLDKNRILSSCDYFAQSLLSFIRRDEWTKRYDSVSLIYGLGIADYFPDTLLSEVIVRGLRLLRRGGRFMITHKNGREFDFQFLDWFCDWTFFHRDEDAFERLVRDCIARSEGRYTFEMKKDQSGEVLFALVDKLD